MRRSTAAAVGTLTGAALILGVRLSVSGGPIAAPPPVFEEVGAAENPRPTPTPASRNKDRKTADPEPEESEAAERQQDDEEPAEESAGESAGDEAPASGLRDGKFSGKPVSNPFGNIQVAITVADGKVTNVAASYPTAGQSASINAGAIPRLKAAVLEAQSADIDAVSGATFTTEAYTSSLQAAFDAARA
jgi:uncharacterized protein with FMN-binding domain